MSRLPYDCIRVIAAYVADGSTYKSFLFSCKAHADALAEVHATYVAKFTNEFMMIYRHFSKAKWDSKLLVKHKKFQFSHFLGRLPEGIHLAYTPDEQRIIMRSVYDKSLRYGTTPVLDCEEMSPEIFLQFFHLKWNIRAIIKWDKFTTEMLLELIHWKRVGKKHWTLITTSRALTVEMAYSKDFKRHVSWQIFYTNPNITVYDFIAASKQPSLQENVWRSKWLNSFTPTTYEEWQMIFAGGFFTSWEGTERQSPEHFLRKYGPPENTTVFDSIVITSADLLLKYKNHINWYLASQYADLSVVKSHPDLPWWNNALIHNENITYDFILSTPERNWDMRTVLCSHAVVSTMSQSLFEEYSLVTFGKLKSEMLECIPNLKLSRQMDIDWHYLSDIAPMTLITDNPDLDWNWMAISKRPELPITFVIEHKNFFRFCWAYLSETQHISVIDAHPELPWKYTDFVIKNPTITLSFILKMSANGITAWNFTAMCRTDNIIVWSGGL